RGRPGRPSAPCLGTTAGGPRPPPPPPPPPATPPATTPPAATKPVPAKPSPAQTPPATPKRPVTLALVQKPFLPAATVNSEPISVGQLTMRLFAVGGPQILDRLVQEQIIRQEARKQRVTISEADIKARLQQELEDFSARFGTPAPFEEYPNPQPLHPHSPPHAIP